MAAFVAVTDTPSTTPLTRGPIVQVVGVLANKGGNWKVQGLVFEGVSLVSSYRSELTKILKKDGWKALFTKMKAMLANGD